MLCVYFIFQGVQASPLDGSLEWKVRESNGIPGSATNLLNDLKEAISPPLCLYAFRTICLFKGGFSKA